MFGNWLKTSILMAGIIALFGAIGGAIGGSRACCSPWSSAAR
jgi:heat shock protein HtpX